ncbi:hypothetical protein ACOMHN_002841 [Nucella lapillus]
MLTPGRKTDGVTSACASPGCVGTVCCPGVASWSTPRDPGTRSRADGRHRTPQDTAGLSRTRDHHGQNRLLLRQRTTPALQELPSIADVLASAEAMKRWVVWVTVSRGDVLLLRP